MGQEVMESLTPAQQVVKIVNEELTKLMGGEEPQTLHIKNKGQTVMMMCGLQGNGKTTHAAKLGRFYKAQGRRPLLVACDIYRPAAIDQLRIVGEQAGVPVYEMGTEKPEKIAKQAVEYAKDHGYDIVIIDTAGRLQIDDQLMDELVRIKQAVEVDETLLVVDAMSGQEAVNVGPDQDGRRHPRRCGAFGSGRYRQANLLPGHRREAGCAGTVLPGAHVQPYPWHGRCAEHDRKGPDLAE